MFKIHNNYICLLKYFEIICQGITFVLSNKGKRSLTVG